VLRIGLAGAASVELVDGVVQLRPQEAMVEAMLRGWRAQQNATGLRAATIDPRERLVRRFLSFTNEFPWQWGPGHVDEWTLTLTTEDRLAPATIRGYQTDLRLFSEYLTDARYGWAKACQDAFGAFPVPICHEWNTIAHLNDYEGSPEARPLSREELQRFLDYADDHGRVHSQHYAFLVGEDDFDAIWGRIRERGRQFWADPFRRRPGEINHGDGGRGVYWDDPDGHVLEILTRPYGSGG